MIAKKLKLLPQLLTLRCRHILISGLLFYITVNPALAQKPNIVFVISDDQSAAHMGSYGNPDVQTPNLDKFAKVAMQFNRMYVASPQCVPSRAALMTGRSPVAIDMTRFSAPLAAEFVSFPELLRSHANYYTGIVGRTYHLDGSGGMPKEAEEVFEKDKLRTFEKRVDYLRTGNPEKALSDLNDFLDKRPKSKPFFIQVGFTDPHRPYTTFVEGKRHDPATLKLPPHFPDTKQLREDFAQYYDEIGHLDRDFGLILKILEDRGLSRNTIVVFMGDNGGALLRGKGTLYEFGIRVPLLVQWPGIARSGAVSETLISGEDLAPTFLGMAGLKAPKEMTGLSFVSILQGKVPSAERDAVFSERGAHGGGLPNNTGAFDLGRCIVTKTHKLVYNALWQLPYFPVDFDKRNFWIEIKEDQKQGRLGPLWSSLYFPPARPMFELFDLKNDPYELANLAGKPEHAALERELKGKLLQWMIRNRDYLPLPIGSR